MLNKKWFARIFDYAVTFLTFGAVCLSLPFYITPWIYLLCTPLIPLLSAPLEALQLKFWGTTIGNRLFNMRVLGEKGQNLTFGAGLKRALSINQKLGKISQKRLSSRRKLVGIVMAALCLLGAMVGPMLSEKAFVSTYASKGTDSWVQYFSDQGKFTVSFPNDPTAQTKNFEVPKADKTFKYDEISSQEGNRVQYSVSYIQFPSKWRWAGSSTLLKGALDVIVTSTPESEVISKQFTKHKNFRALDYHMKEGQNEVKGRLVIVGARLYKLTVTYHPSVADYLKHEEFLQSFDIQ